MSAEIGRWLDPKKTTAKKSRPLSILVKGNTCHSVYFNCMKTKQCGVYLTDGNLFIRRPRGLQHIIPLNVLYFLKLSLFCPWRWMVMCCWDFWRREVFTVSGTFSGRTLCRCNAQSGQSKGGELWYPNRIQ